MHVLVWNCNGLSRDKQENDDFLNMFDNYDLICLLESWTDQRGPSDIQGYETLNFYRKFQNRQGKRNNGGIVLYCRSAIFPGIEIVENHYDTINMD